MLIAAWTKLGLSLKYLYSFLNLLLLTGNLEERCIWQSLHNLCYAQKDIEEVSQQYPAYRGIQPQTFEKLPKKNSSCKFDINRLYCHMHHELKESGAYVVYVDDKKLRQALKNKIRYEYRYLNQDTKKITQSLKSIKFKTRESLDYNFIFKKIENLELFDREKMLNAFNEVINQNPHSILTRTFEDFDPQYLSRNLFNNTHELNIKEQDVLDIITYFAQSLFLRNAGQERDSTDESKFLQYNKSSIEKEFKKLNLLDEKLPQKNKSYSESWVFGASYEAFKLRTKFLKRLFDEGYSVGKVRLTCGFRELWAPIDAKFMRDANGYPTRRDMEQGKRRLLTLADKFNIKYNKSKPFVKYVSNAEFDKEFLNAPENTKIKSEKYMPHHRLTGKVYLNPTEGSGYLTEWHIAKHLGDKYLQNIGYDIVYSKPAPGEKRVHTTETINEAIKSSELDSYSNKSIIAVSNQPYISRQCFDAERVLKQNGYYNVNIEGVGREVVFVPSINAGEELAIELLSRYEFYSPNYNRLGQIRKITRKNVNAPRPPKYENECRF